MWDLCFPPYVNRNNILLSVIYTYTKCLSLGCHNKSPQTGQLKPQIFISHGFGDWKSEIRVPAYSGSWRGLSSWLCAHMAFLGDREPSWFASFYQDINPVMVGLMTSSKPPYLSQAPPPNMVTVGIRLQHEFWEAQSIVFPSQLYQHLYFKKRKWQRVTSNVYSGLTSLKDCLHQIISIMKPFENSKCVLNVLVIYCCTSCPKTQWLKTTVIIISGSFYGSRV